MSQSSTLDTSKISESKGERPFLTHDPQPSPSFFSRSFRKHQARKKAEQSSASTTRLGSIPLYALFRYADRPTRITVSFAVIFSALHGLSPPFFSYLLGRSIDDFNGVIASPGQASKLPSTIKATTNIYLVMAFVLWALTFAHTYLSLSAANSVRDSLRMRFFDALLRQNPAFFDNIHSQKAVKSANDSGDNESHGASTEPAQSFVATAVEAIDLIHSAVGDKLGSAVFAVVKFSASIILSFHVNWKLALVLLAVVPVLLISGALFARASAHAAGTQVDLYASATSVASEAIGLIRVVTAFSAQRSEAARYNRAATEAYRASARASLISSTGLGFSLLVVMSSYALAFWYGASLVRASEITAGDVLLVMIAVSISASSLGGTAPAFKAFSTARAVAPRVFEIIELQSEIDPLDLDEGRIPADEVRGNLSFCGVDFVYDNSKFVSNQTADFVLQNFDLDIKSGSSEALVGRSGSGKSTVAALLQRLYDPVGGKILLDGTDLRDLNVRWLRSQIGVVQQMPSLFSLSIRDNIALGARLVFSRDPKTGITVASRQVVTDEDVVRAAKMANAHDFIVTLPDGYDTMLGERGTNLSGGQKQRVCIARALVRDPKILILDESTASLDADSERVVQEALERASAGRTTLTIAHRLDTVQKCDSISCLHDGRVIERGSHDSLLAKEDGHYRALFDTQILQHGTEIEPHTEQEDLHQNTEVVPKSSSTDEHPDQLKKSGDVLQEKGNTVLQTYRSRLNQRTFFRVLSLNAPEFPQLIVGTIGSVVAGVISPVMAIALANILGTLQGNINNRDVIMWSSSFLLLGLAAFVGNVLQHGVLGIAGERLTLRTRSTLFQTLISREIGFFDMKENSTSVLTTLLSSDAAALKGVTVQIISTTSFIASVIISSLVIAFISSWQIALIIFAIVPGIGLTGYFQVKASAGLNSKASEKLLEANAVVAEAIDNISTVRSLCVEDVFLRKFDDTVTSSRTTEGRGHLITGMAFGFSKFCIYILFFATFRAGGIFIQQSLITFKQMLQALLALMLGAFSLGKISVYASDIGKSVVAARRVLKALDGKGEGGMDNEGAETLERMTSSVSLKDVYFEYPSRKDAKVLQGLSLSIDSGKTLAVVGPSGHGKSTIISLLERFYDVREGVISIDGKDIRAFNILQLRQQMSLVQQEPELFNRSVFENIAYGLCHNEGTVVTQAQVEDAARAANAHEFIERLPEGYSTRVGIRGEQLSGGQRQRIAIARALIRKPRILLLDEATSALDGESEKIVQVALNEATDGMTTIVVAHRLSAIRNADKICLISDGKVVESGTHEELMRLKEQYFKLFTSQAGEVL